MFVKTLSDSRGSRYNSGTLKSSTVDNDNGAGVSTIGKASNCAGNSREANGGHNKAIGRSAGDPVGSQSRCRAVGVGAEGGGSHEDNVKSVGAGSGIGDSKASYWARSSSRVAAGELVVVPSIVVDMINTPAETNSELGVSDRADIGLFGGTKVAPLGELVVVEGVALLVDAALGHAVFHRLARGEAGVGQNFNVVAPAEEVS